MTVPTAATAGQESGGSTDEATLPPAIPLVRPRDGIPEVVSTPAALQASAERIAAGSGPVAVDAERASGYRYGQRAYLLQLRREGSGTTLIDPVAVADLAPLRRALAGVEWVLHAANQDLPCLRELDLVPDALFDTELAGRLLGFPKVGLATLVRSELGLGLAKEHSAVDWSTRPLPEPWLAYAALDVEVLVALRDRMDEQLREHGKREWAAEEFEAVRLAPPPLPRAEPWRRTSGVHKLRRPRQLAVARALWYARDQVARERDVAPGRVLPDAAVVAAAVTFGTAADPGAGEPALAELPAYATRGARRHLRTWVAAVVAARALPDSELPALHAPLDGPPPPRSWPDRDPAAAARLVAVRAALAAVADEVHMPSENLLAPDAVKRISWRPPATLGPSSVATALSELGARRWQVGLTTAAVLTGLTAAH